MSARVGSLRGVLSGLMVEVRRPGESGLSGEALWRAGQIVLTAVIVTANVIGAGVVIALAYFVVPLPQTRDPAHVELVNGLVAAGYVVVAVPIGWLVGARRVFALRRWLIEGGPAGPREQRIVLRAPLRLFGVQVALWFAAAVLFGILNASYSGTLGLRVGVVVVITGLVTAACAYLLTERILRSSAARALVSGTPERLAVPGVATRAVLAWGIGTGLPIAGVVAVGIIALSGESVSRNQLGISMVVLGSIGITVGLLAVTLAARATADPVDSVRRALERVQAGDLDVHVPVYDGTQIGKLQLGFNRMVDGLAERERIRQAFGTYVDPEVARHILEEGTQLEGEEVEVTIMFIDIREFTPFVERTPAREVVATINALFERIVPVIYEHGGHVDKYIGDGLLAVFGAPRRLSDHADRALAAALEISRSIGESDALRIGIGLNSGPVVAGNVGGGGRLEFSVIGDVVNAAARIEAATRQTGDNVLIADRTKDLLQGSDGRFEERPGLELKGKAEQVRLFAPVP